MTIRVHSYVHGVCKACGAVKDNDHIGPSWCSGRRSAKSEIEALQAEVERLTRERDEARRAYTFRGGYIEDETGDRWWSSELLARVERQRDHARDEIERLRAVADAARELLSWDWMTLLDQDDGNSSEVCRDVGRLEAALKALDGDKT